MFKPIFKTTQDRYPVFFMLINILLHFFWNQGSEVIMKVTCFRARAWYRQSHCRRNADGRRGLRLWELLARLRGLFFPFELINYSIMVSLKTGSTWKQVVHHTDLVVALVYTLATPLMKRHSHYLTIFALGGFFLVFLILPLRLPPRHGVFSFLPLRHSYDHHIALSHCRS